MNKIFYKLKSFIKSKKLLANDLETFREFGEKSTPWWGKFQVEAGQSRFWRVGNVVVYVDRFTNEWHITNSEIANVKPKDEDSSIDKGIDTSELKFRTYTFRTQAEISLTPVLADRSIASELERSLSIPGGEEILLYVSSPVWVRVTTGSSNIILEEIPTFHLSDTWFGINTRYGELCYAGHTYCSTSLKDVPFGPDRIISPMLIKNHSKSILILEKIRVPLPYLSVYSDEQNYLWTEQLIINRSGEDQPEVMFAKGPPKALENIVRLSSAREELRKGSSIKRLFDSVIGG